MKFKAFFSRLLPVILAVLVIISTISVFADISDEGWVYEQTAGNSEYYIKNYTGTSDKVQIPALYLTKRVTKVNANAFLNNTEISYVQVPATVKEIGQSAFNGCIKLSEVEFLGDIEKIGAHIFYGCESLTAVNMRRVSSLKVIPVNCFNNCINIITFKVPDGVEFIGDRAFFNCQSLESIIIPDSVKEISDIAFKDCKKLTIYGNDKSFAQSYAAKNNIPFALIDSYVEPTMPDVKPVPTETTTATEVITTTSTEPSQSYTDPTEPSETSTTDPSETLGEDIIPTNPIITVPDYDPFESSPTGSESSSDNPTDSSDPDATTVPGSGSGRKYIIGDSDLSGEVTVRDATLIQKYAASLVMLDKTQLFLANCNGNGDVNVKDATQIQKYCAGFLNILFVGQEVEL